MHTLREASRSHRARSTWSTCRSREDVHPGVLHAPQHRSSARRSCPTRSRSRSTSPVSPWCAATEAINEGADQAGVAASEDGSRGCGWQVDGRGLDDPALRASDSTWTWWVRIGYLAVRRHSPVIGSPEDRSRPRSRAGHQQPLRPAWSGTFDDVRIDGLDAGTTLCVDTDRGRPADPGARAVTRRPAPTPPSTRGPPPPIWPPVPRARHPAGRRGAGGADHPRAFQSGDYVAPRHLGHPALPARRRGRDLLRALRLPARRAPTSPARRRSGPPGDAAATTGSALLRIFPVYVVTVVIALSLIPDNDGSRRRRTGCARCSLTRHLLRPSCPHGLTQMWSLAVEVAFYARAAAADAALVGRRRRCARPGCWSCWPDGAVSRAGGIVGLALVGRAARRGLRLLWLPAYLTWFAVGIALALVTCAPASRAAGRRVRPHCRGSARHARGLLGGVAAGCSLVCAHPLAGPSLLFVATPARVARSSTCSTPSIGGPRRADRHLRRPAQPLRAGRCRRPVAAAPGPHLLQHLLHPPPGAARRDVVDRYQLFRGHGLQIWSLTLVLSACRLRTALPARGAARPCG